MPGTINVLEATVEGLQYELHVRELRLQEKDHEIERLRQQVEELKKQASGLPLHCPLPPFVKPNVPHRRRKKPGRVKGDEAALRPIPAKIDYLSMPWRRGP